MRGGLVVLLVWLAGCAGGADTGDTSADVVNLLENGSFDSDASGWTAENATLTAEGGWLVVTTGPGGTGGHAWQEVVVEDGEPLKLTAAFGDATYEGSAHVRVGVAENDDSLGYVSPDAGEQVFFASGTSVIITCNNVADGAGEYAWFDDVVLQRVE